jgi:hypothetical protein
VPVIPEADSLLRQQDQVRQVVQAEIEVGRSIHQNRAETVAIIRDWLEVSHEEGEESFDFALPAIVRDGHINVEVWGALTASAGSRPID